MRGINNRKQACTQAPRMQDSLWSSFERSEEWPVAGCLLSEEKEVKANRIPQPRRQHLEALQVRALQAILAATIK